jgi:hypothetical protein
MASVILIAITAMILLVAGFAMYTTNCSDPRGKEQWERRTPYFYIGVGLVVVIAGWLSHAGAASWLQMAAGLTLAISGAYLALRRRSSRHTWDEW